MIVKRICICFVAFFMATFLFFGALSVPHSTPNSYSSFSTYTKSRNIFPNLETVSDVVSSLSDALNEFSFEEMVKDYNMPIQSNRPILDVAGMVILDNFKPFIFIGRFAGNVFNVVKELINTLQNYRFNI